MSRHRKPKYPISRSFFPKNQAMLWLSIICITGFISACNSFKQGFKHGYNNRKTANQYQVVTKSGQGAGNERIANIAQFYKQSELGRFLDRTCRGNPSAFYETLLRDGRRSHQLYYATADSVYFFSETKKHGTNARYDSARTLVPSERELLKKLLAKP